MTNSGFGIPKEEAYNYDFVEEVRRIMDRDHNNNTITTTETSTHKQFAQIVKAYECDPIPVARESALEIDRFLIIYRHSGHEVSEQRALGMCWPENILAINSKNKAAAFYPTSWETETFKPTTSVREVFVKKL